MDVIQITEVCKWLLGTCWQSDWQPQLGAGWGWGRATSLCKGRPHFTMHAPQVPGCPPLGEGTFTPLGIQDEEASWKALSPTPLLGDQSLSPHVTDGHSSTSPARPPSLSTGALVVASWTVLLRETDKLQIQEPSLFNFPGFSFLRDKGPTLWHNFKVCSQPGSCFI